jgi:hypothetical protein
MANGVHIVLSQPPDGVSNEEFDAWYEGHVPEILAVPGFISAQRYRLEANIVDPVSPATYNHLVIYEFESDPDEAMAELQKAGVASTDDYEDAKTEDPDSHELPLPDWFGDVRFATWHCTPIGERAASNS